MTLRMHEGFFGIRLDGVFFQILIPFTGEEFRLSAWYLRKRINGRYKKKFTLKNGRDIWVKFPWIHESKRRKIENYYFFIYLTLKIRLAIVYLRVKSPWMQKQNKRANERSGAREQSDQCVASE